jgi:octaprenyl-diphosphate synthase
MNRLSLPNLYLPIAAKLEDVEAELQKTLRSEVPVMRRLAEYISGGSGKRLRPALVLLASRFCGYTGNEDIRYAVACELMHTASLVHDDVIDHATTRRGNPSLNARWGNTLSVLFGDFLALQSTLCAAAGRNWTITDLFANVAVRMVEGEIIQHECKFGLDTDRSRYFDIIERKTGILFAACTESGAIVADCDIAVRQSMARFGLELGKAFQLIDDLLDYVSTSDQLGKPVFSDLQEGRLTLPIIALIEKAPKETTPIIERVWDKSAEKISAADTKVLLELMEHYGTLDETRELAGHASTAAIDSLPQELGNTEIAELLQEIPRIMLERTY